MKLRILCKSKIHHAVITGADLNYIGSIGIDRSLMDLTGLVEGEQVAVRGARLLGEEQHRAPATDAPGGGAEALAGALAAALDGDEAAHLERPAEERDLEQLALGEDNGADHCHKEYQGGNLERE